MLGRRADMWRRDEEAAGRTCMESIQSTLGVQSIAGHPEVLPHLELADFMATATKTLGLYRYILRLHRSLPSTHRALGDRYLKEEWRLHRNAKPEFLPAFLRSWER